MKNINMKSVNKTLAEIERLAHPKWGNLFRENHTTAMQQVVSQVLKQYRMHGNQVLDTNSKTQATQVYQINSLNDVKDIMNRIMQLSQDQAERSSVKNR